MPFFIVNGRRFRVPGRPVIRLVLGIALIVGGLLGFLPILGFWMLPLGILLLSVDFHLVRRQRRRFEVWWGRRRAARKASDSLGRSRRSV